MRKLKLFMSFLLCIAVTHILATPVASVSDIQEGKIYTIGTSSRGAIAWDGASGKLYGTGVGTTPDASNPNHQFTFIKKGEITDSLYMVNIGADKFVFQDGTNASLVDVSHALWTIKSSDNSDYPFMIDAESGNHWNLDNHSTIYINNWSTKDAGNCFAFKEIGDVEETYVQELKERLGIYVPTSIPNDEIWYEASYKLAEALRWYESGLHTNAFNTTIASHTFSDGKGVIKFNGKVTSIGEDAFRLCSSLASITIPNSVTSIGESAFSGCSSLTSITIPNSVTSIGGSAFWRCSSLASITIPNSVTSIGNYAFGQCISLTSISIPNSVTSIEYEAFYYCSNLASISIPNSVTSIGGSAFEGCSSIASITIPNSVKSIGESAFKDCSSLTSVTIPNSVTSIGNDAFSGCTSLPVIDNARYAGTYLVGVVNKALSSYKIEEGTIWIGSSAFNNCSSLTSVTIPNSVTSIGDWAFYSCSKLTSVTIGNSVTSIGRSAFSDCSSLTSATIPNSVISIGYGAFMRCSSLTSITIPNSVTNIEEQAFSNCYNVKELIYADGTKTAFYTGLTYIKHVIIPNSVTSIGDHAFRECSSLTSVTIPNSVTSIGEWAFFDCSSLISVTIPNSITSIGENAFYMCSKLAKIYCYADKLPSTGSYVFDYVPLSSATLYVPKNSIESYKTTSPWSEFGTITELQPNDEIWYTSYKGQVVTPNKTDVFGANILSNTYENGKGIIKFSENVTSIGAYAFNGCSLTSINIPNSVTNIGKNALYNCWRLTSIHIGKSVIQIGENAFSGCSALTSIDVDISNPIFDSREDCNAIIETASDKLILGCVNTVIPNTVFCLGDDAFNYTALSAVDIPNSVKSIGARCFKDCYSLTSVNIPNSVTSIGWGAFSGCKNISSITLPDSLISIEGGTFHGCEKLSTISLGNAIHYIGGGSGEEGGAFYGCSTLTSISIPNSVKSIGSYAFDGCSNLSTVVLPNSLTGISDYMFAGCTSLTSINIPNSVKYIGPWAFAGCTELNSIIIPDSVNTIYYSAFNRCLKLTSVILPKSLKSIGWHAFNLCTKLVNVYCYADEISSTDELAFENVPLSLSTLYVPKNSIDFYKTASPWSEFGTITNIPEPNVFITDLSDNTSKIEVKSNDTFSLSDNIKSIEITEAISDVNLTYTRNFSDAMVNNWQAWYMPCDFDYDDLSEDFDVAEIAGVLFDKDGQNYVAFRKMTEGTVKAHTPYVVRAKEAGDVSITTTTTLQPTSGSKSFSMQSAYNNFTFGGVYENTYLSAEQPTYALNKSGNFALMSESVYLRPFRIYMRIADREDNPYAAVTAPQEVKVVVLGEDETSIDEIHNSQFIIHNDESSEIYNLGGQKLQKLQKGINIVNGRKVLY